MSKGGVLGIIAAVLLYFTCSETFFTVNQIEQAVIIRLGEPVGVVKEPGLHCKWPLTENVVFFDKRLMSVELSTLEVTLGDKRRILVDAFGRYRIINPLKFFQSVGTEREVLTKLNPIVFGSLSSVLGNIDLKSLLSDSRSLTTTKIRNEVNKAAKEFGIEIVDIRIRKTDLPPQNSEAICKRMISEREREAREIRAKGFEMSKIIKSTADKENAIAVADANVKVQHMLAEGEQKASQIYISAFSKDKDFFKFFLSLDAYKEALNSQDTTFVISPSHKFFKFLREGI